MSPTISARHLMYLRFLGNASCSKANPDLFKIGVIKTFQDKGHVKVVFHSFQTPFCTDTLHLDISSVKKCTNLTFAHCDNSKDSRTFCSKTD